MYFCNHKDYSFFRKWTWTAIAHFTSNQVRLWSIIHRWKNQSCVAILNKTTTKCRRLCVDRATDDCIAPSSNKDWGPADKIVSVGKTGLPESFSPVTDVSSLTPTTDGLEEFCSTFLCIAKQIIERICRELLKCFFKYQILFIKFNEPYRIHVDNIQYRPNFKSNAVDKTSFIKQILRSKSGLMFELV